MKRFLITALFCFGALEGAAAQLTAPPKAEAGGGPTVADELVRAVRGPEWERSTEDLGFKVREERVQVVVASLDAPGTGVWIEERGGTHVAVSGDLVQAWVPRSLVNQLLREEGVIAIDRPDYAANPRPVGRGVAGKEGDETSEGVAAINAAAWHAAGFTGSGVKVGIIDGGFEDYEDLLGADLPPSGRIQFRSFGGSTNVGSGNHGTACAEIVTDVAPGAELYLALVSTNIDIEAALRWLQQNDVHVATMSLGFNTLSPGDGTGSLHRVIGTLVQDGDLVFANSAGNSRRGHWQGLTEDEDEDGWVEFEPGEEVNEFARTFAAGDEISTSIVWNDWTDVMQDYSLHLFREEDGSWTEVASADRFQAGFPGQRPTETLDHTVSGSGRYGIGIFRKSVTGLNDLEVFDPDWNLELRVEEGSLTLPADSPDVMAAAAAAPTGSYALRSFSSAGPANGPGGSIDGGTMKPEITGYDGVSTVSMGRFYGTSSASPHVAGTAALVRQAEPSWTQAEVRAFLEDRAIDKGPPGQDRDYGWGRLSAGLEPGSTCTFSISPQTATIGAADSGTRVAVAAGDGCFWSASSDVSWIEVLPDSGLGSGLVIVRTEVNESGAARQGVVTIAGLDFVVTQGGTNCEVDVSPAAAEFAALGGNGEVAVAADASCAWTATTSATWIGIVGDASGTGSGIVSYTVAANSGDAPRIGAIQVGDREVAISQGAATSWVARVGGVADAEGDEGTRWNSDLALLNATDGDIDATLIYRHGDGEVVRLATVAAGSIVEWPRAAVDLFGVGEASGAVEVGADGPLRLTVRTYNDDEAGTFGQLLPGVVPGDGLAPGTRAVLAPLASSLNFRTNVGFVDVSGTGGTGVVSLYDAGGGRLGATVEIEVEPGGWSQRNRIFTAAGAGSCDGCYAVVEVVGEEAELWAYASVVDNDSGDPTTVSQVPLAASKAARRWLVAGIAESEGDNDTRWKSTLAVVNHTGGALEVDAGFRSAAGDSDIVLSFPGNGMEIETDAVGEFFGAQSAAGAVVIVSDGAAVTTARTYNEGPDGTFGQFLPAVEEEAAIAPGGTGHLTQIKGTDDFRTNIGFVNFAAETCEVRIRLFDENGDPKGKNIDVEVPPGGWFQKNKVFKAAGVSECPLAFATVEALSPSCSVWAYASVVDNGSGDPTTIPMSVH